MTSVGRVAPLTRVSRGWTFRYALLWFGFWTANLAPVQLVLPDQFDRFDHAHKVRDFGIVSGATGVVALLALPVFGALCDRTRSRFGRRRVWIAAGAAVFAAGLVATGLQHSWVGVGVAWLVATIGIDMATAGATAVIADAVPDDQRGAISAAIYGPQAVGILIGVALLTAIGTDGVLGYAVLAVLLIACTVPFVMRHRDIVDDAVLPLTLRSVLGGLWVRSSDFAWAFSGRLLVNTGNALGTTYLLYFLTDDLRLERSRGRAADPHAGVPDLHADGDGGGWTGVGPQRTAAALRGGRGLPASDRVVAAHRRAHLRGGPGRCGASSGPATARTCPSTRRWSPPCCPTPRRGRRTSAS